jgi:hypothetical protein
MQIAAKRLAQSPLTFERVVHLKETRPDIIAPINPETATKLVLAIVFPQS